MVQGFVHLWQHSPHFLFTPSAQRGLQYLICVSVCLHLFSHYRHQTGSLAIPTGRWKTRTRADADSNADMGGDLGTRICYREECPSWNFYGHILIVFANGIGHLFNTKPINLAASVP